MIRSFSDKATAMVFSGAQPRSMARNLAAAAHLDDLRAPPGNRLESLKGDRAGAHSIRINRQWRIAFVWREDGAHAVEIVDYP